MTLLKKKIFLSEDKWVQCGNECKYNHGGYKKQTKGI